MDTIMRCGACCATLATFLFVSASTRAATLVIDSFDSATASWPQSQATIGGGITENIGDVLGSFRYTQITEAVLDEAFDSVQVGVFPSAGVFDYASSVGADGRAILAYDGDGALSADLFDTPIIVIEFALFDFANNLPLEASVTLRNDEAVETVDATLAAPVTGGSQTLNFDFTPFGGILDFSQINEIVVDFDPGIGGDFRIHEIRAIPEPASLSLLLLGALLMRRRRHR